MVEASNLFCETKIKNLKNHIKSSGNYETQCWSRMNLVIIGISKYFP